MRAWTVKVAGSPFTEKVEADHAIVHASGALMFYERIEASSPDVIARAFAPGSWLEVEVVPSRSDANG